MFLFLHCVAKLGFSPFLKYILKAILNKITQRHTPITEIKNMLEKQQIYSAQRHMDVDP